MLYAKFTPEGFPAHIIAQPQDGYDALPEGMTEYEAAGLMLVKGEWVPRPPPPPPTEAELAARAEAERTAQAEAEAEIERAMMEEAFRRALPEMHLRTAGKITIAQYNARFAAIEEAVRAGR